MPPRLRKVSGDLISSVWDHGIKGVAVGPVVNVVLAAPDSAQPTGARLLQPHMHSHIWIMTL